MSYPFKPDWNFRAQETKLGYINNPRWVDKSSATKDHTPCGYWYKKYNPSAGNIEFPELGEPLPFLAYVVEDPTNPDKLGYVLCDGDMNPLFYVSEDDYNLFTEITVDGVSGDLVTTDNGSFENYEELYELFVEISHTAWSELTQQYETHTEDIGTYLADYEIYYDQLLQLTYPFTLGDVVKTGQAVNHITEESYSPSEVGVFARDTNYQGYWADRVYSLYDLNGLVFLAKFSVNTDISNIQTNAITLGGAYEDNVTKLYVALTPFLNGSSVENSIIRWYAGSSKNLIDLSEPSLVYTGTATSAPGIVPGETLAYTKSELGPYLDHYLTYYGNARHKEHTSHVIQIGYNSVFNESDEIIMRRDEEYLRITSRAYDAVAIKAAILAAGYQTSYVPDIALEGSVGSSVFLYETSSEAAPQ